MTDFEKNPELEEALDEALEVNVITLTDDETGEEQDFEIWARATVDEQLYYALVPVEDEGDEYVILKATEQDDEVFFETIDDDIAAIEAELEELAAQQDKFCADYVKLQELNEKQAELEARLEEKMERWMYLNELNEKIQAQK